MDCIIVLGLESQVGYPAQLLLMGASTRVLVRGAVSSHTARCVLRTRMAYAFALGSYKSANVAITPATQTSWRLSLYAHGCESTTQYGTDFRMLYCVRDSKVHARVGVYVSYVCLRSRSGCMLPKTYSFECKMVSLSCSLWEADQLIVCVDYSSRNQMASVPLPPNFFPIFVRIWPCGYI